MGDSFQSFTLPETGGGSAEAVAAQISGWLVAKGIGRKGAITAPPGVTGLAPGPRADDALASKQSGWQDSAFDEIHICPTRRVTAAVQGGLGPVSCPDCETLLGDSQNLPPAFMRAVDEWHSGSVGMLKCPACGSSFPITKWRTEPYWAFGNVTITFWNWPRIKDSFARELEAETGQPVKVVRGKI